MFNPFFAEMKRILPLLILFAMVAGGCYDRHDEPQPKPFDDFSNFQIGELRNRCQGGCITIESHTICVGRITSSDHEGNFYRTIVVEDESGGAEIKLGIYNSAVPYPIGLMVSLRLEGLAAMVKDGVVQVGLPPQTFDLAPRELEAQEVIDQHIVRSNSVEPTPPTHCDIASLNASLCGRFIAIKGLRHSPTEELTAEGYYRFTDSDKREVFCYISPYAEFAGCEIPDSQVAIQGILYRETINSAIGEQFIIKPRFKDDISVIDSI